MSSKSKTSKEKDVDEREEGIGQGELYSPDHAIHINPKQNAQTGEERDWKEGGSNTMVGRGVAMDIRTRMGSVKDRLLEKLAAASVPSDALENAKHFVETVIRDVTSAAQGLTKEALQKIKSHLADILPSLSPSLTSKMVDDAEKEAGGGERGQEKDDEKTTKGSEAKNEEQNKGKLFVSPVSSLFSSFIAKPVSKL